MRTLSSAGLAFVALLVGCGGDDDACECKISDVTLTVTVLDAQTGQLVAAPSFTESSDLGAVDARCTADADAGECPSWSLVFEGLDPRKAPTSPQSLTVSAAGHAPSTVTFTLHKHDVGCGCVAVVPIDETVKLTPAS